MPQSQTVAPSFAWPVNDEWDLLVVAGHGKVFKFRPPATRDDAMTEIRAAFGYPQKRTELAPCGSLAAYSRHKTRREDCDECSQAASPTCAHTGSTGRRKLMDDLDYSGLATHPVVAAVTPREITTLTCAGPMFLH